MGRDGEMESARPMGAGVGESVGRSVLAVAARMVTPSTSSSSTARSTKLSAPEGVDARGERGRVWARRLTLALMVREEMARLFVLLLHSTM